MGRRLNVFNDLFFELKISSRVFIALKFIPQSRSEELRFSLEKIPFEPV